MVKESSPADYPDRTYEEAFENFFDDPVWQYWEDDGEKYIWFLGQCQVNGQVSNCEVHFQLDLENGRFRVVYYEVDHWKTGHRFLRLFLRQNRKSKKIIICKSGEQKDIMCPCDLVKYV